MRNIEKTLADAKVKVEVTDVTKINAEERNFVLNGTNANLKKAIAVLNDMGFNCDNIMIGLSVPEDIGSVMVCDYNEPGYLAMPKESRDAAVTGMAVSNAFMSILVSQNTVAC